MMHEKMIKTQVMMLMSSWQQTSFLPTELVWMKSWVLKGGVAEIRVETWFATSLSIVEEVAAFLHVTVTYQQYIC
jgi:hypothetical protein